MNPHVALAKLSDKPLAERASRPAESGGVESAFRHQRSPGADSREQTHNDRRWVRGAWSEMPAQVANED